MSNHHDLPKCFCLPAADTPSKPLLKTLTIASEERSFSFVLTHLATFVLANDGRTRKLTMAFPTHRVTLQAEGEAADKLENVVLGSCDLVRDRTETLKASPPASECVHAESAPGVLEVTKVAVARRPEYAY